MAWHWQFICKTLWSTQPAFLSVSNRTPIKRCRWRLCARSRQQIQQKQADRNKSYYGSLQPPPPLLSLYFNKVSQRNVCQPFWALSHPALFARPEVPAQTLAEGQSEERQTEKTKTKTEGYEFPIDVAGFFFFDSLPETRSTPFCNHTLHFGGLTIRNT